MDKGGLGGEVASFYIHCACPCQAHIWVWLHITDLLLQCQWSLCWQAPHDDTLQTLEKTGLTVLIRWLLNHLWAVFLERLIIIYPNSCLHPSCFGFQSHLALHKVMNVVLMALSQQFSSISEQNYLKRAHSWYTKPPGYCDLCFGR